jgi:CubicO group peptidase (beta-lactamase class C family)
MGIGTVNRTMALMSRLLNLRKSTVPILPASPQKPPCSPVMVQQPFERVSPESQGISSSHIAHFLEKLHRDRTLNMHSLLLLRNGKMVTEVSFGSQDVRIPKMTFSACKSITALAIGMLIDEGTLSLDTHVVDIFPDKTTPVTRLRYKELTVEHLLTMTSGVPFNEAECMTQSDWLRSFFGGMPNARPGKTFAYNSLNTYVLAAIVVRVTGQSLTDYLRPRLWEPLGITDLFWETCPEGIEKGGWGLYIAAEDMAKIGQLVLQQGLWKGKQLISQEWLEKAASFKKKVPEEYGDFDYGFHIWVGRKYHAVLFNGMLGQNVLAFPDTGILIVTNAGNDELFQQSRYFELVQEYFGGEFPAVLPNNEEQQRYLNGVIASCRPSLPAAPRVPWWQRVFSPQTKPLPEECYAWDGMVLHGVSPNAASVGLLPVILQTTQNNYTGGFLSLHFGVVGDRFTVTYSEIWEDHRFSVGFSRSQITELYFHGEPYRVAVHGRFARNEENEPVLIINVDFLETPCTRTIKIILGEGEARLCQTERPGEPFLHLLLAEIKQKLDEHPLISAAAEKVDEDYIAYKIQGLFSPVVKMEKIKNL